ncbi:MAG: selenium metabolism-associated LysR family transcriptional regulator [Thermodesulfobacteriota bacterium]
MDLKRLSVFGKVMETRSFSRTARELSLTQPTVSGHIKSLEEEIGLTLFDRHRRLVKPTAAAVVLYDYAQKLLDLSREAGYALERFRGRVAGGMRLGGSNIPGAYFLPAVISRFHRLYPETCLSLVISDTAGIVDLTARGEIELGLVGAVHERADLTYEALLEDEMVLAAPPDHPLAQARGQADLKALAGSDIILREEGSGTRKAMLAALTKAGLEIKDLRIVAELGGTEAVRQAVKAGLGASILSYVAVADEVKAGSIKAVKVRGLDLSRRFYIVTNEKRTRSPVAAAFLEFVRTEGKNMAWFRPEKTK